MGRRPARPSNNKRSRPGGKRGDRAAPVREPPPVYERKPPVVYGEPFVVMENLQRETFVFVGGAWAPFEKSIAECRQDCRVTELSQKIKGMTRYEVRRPV